MTKIITCKHQPVDLDDRAFMGPVYQEPFTSENRAAHGNITRAQKCAVCGATRRVNINQHHYEYSPWMPRP